MNADRERHEPDWVGQGLFLNEDGMTVADLLPRWLLQDAPSLRQVTLATGYVSFGGLQLLAPALKRLLDSGVQVRLLIGVEPTRRAELVRPASGSAIREAVGRALVDSDRDLRAELDVAPTSGATPWRLDQLRTVLRHSGFACRRWEHRFLHGKAAAAVDVRGRCRAVAGSFNVTMPGLTTSAEIGLSASASAQARATTSQLEAWWRLGQDFDLASFIDERLCPYPAELVYLRMLLARFGDEVNAPVSRLRLRPFQRDGVAKTLSVLERYGGVLLADEVGLGKTYMAGEVIRRTLIAEQGPVLVLCPAHIKYAVWRHRLDEWDLHADLLSYSQLVYAVRRLIHTHSQWQQYGLIVLDESHKLRTPSTKWRWAVQEVLGHQAVRPRMLLLSGTPVQNRGRDLYEQLMLAAPPTDATPQAPDVDGTPRMPLQELRDLCDHADKLNARDLARLHGELQRLTVRRTRPFIVHAYAREADSLTFPRVRQEPVRYVLPGSIRGLFGDVLDAVGQSHWPFGPDQAATIEQLRGQVPRVGVLELAAYSAESYRLDATGTPTWLPLLLGLLRACMLKRIESSIAAFAATAANMAARTETALEELQEGKVRVHIPNRVKRQIHELLDTPAPEQEPEADRDYDTLIDQYIGGVRPSPTDLARSSQHAEFRYHPAELFDRAHMREDLEHDLAILRHLQVTAAAAVPDDPKPAVLAVLLDRIAHDRRGPKTVLFAGARVTTADLGRRLRGDNTMAVPAVFEGRIASLGGPEPPSKEYIQHVLAHFAPKTAADLTTQIGSALPDDLYDLLITTDILAEGVNLQQASFVVHYDLPWNPQLLAQRTGRIDRLGAFHSEAVCFTVLPDIGLDLVLGLMDTLLAKTRVAAASIGTPSELFPGAPVEPRDFTDIVERLDRPQRRRGRLPLEEPQRVWLAQALRNPELCSALHELPLWAGAIHPRPHDTPAVVYCFNVLGATPDRPRTTAFARVLGPPHEGAITLDPARCLRAAHTNLNQWLDRSRQERAAPNHTVTATDLHLVWDLLDYARSHIADAHAIPAEAATDRIQLLAWMYLAPPTQDPNHADAESGSAEAPGTA